MQLDADEDGPPAMPIGVRADGAQVQQESAQPVAASDDADANAGTAAIAANAETPHDAEHDQPTEQQPSED